MKRFLLIVIATMMVTAMQAQPAKRRTTTSNEAAAQGGTVRNATTQATDRASMMFPTSEAMPEDVSWRRDIYRQLDLKKDKNAALYYPVEPNGQQVNLFTYLFRLMLSGRVSAYEYNTSGNESFAEKDKITDLELFLKRFYIYYEMQNGRINVADTDVPSAFVTRYYIKESAYFDQRTGTTHTAVTALCPIMIESDDFGEGTPQPLFWMKYDDVAPYLSKLPVMSSDLNNVTNMTANDFFALNRYEGKIYKTNNMQGQTLNDYCQNDTAMLKEQLRIEKQLTDFEEHLWGHDKQDSIMMDSTGVAVVKTTKVKKTTSAKSSEEKSSSQNRRASSSGNKKEKSASSSSAPRVSARRERR